MGLAASSGHDNDELIDKLVDANIVSDFGSPGRIHISAPCIYGNVLECLNLQEGNSFLNVGSGTGYLSTVAGYLLGGNGTNHGIEIHSNIVDYARELVTETLHRPETQCYDWAVPEFACGNGLYLSPSHYSKYDRVYCGAAVPASHRRILWELLKIDGILVMPYDDQLLQVRRQATNVFEVRIITSVSFSDFILPTEEETSNELYSNAPSFIRIPTLQFLCALTIRKIIRSAVGANHKIHIRNFVSQQPERTHDEHVVVEYRDGEQPVAHQPHFDNLQPPFREILAIVGADFAAENENENENNDEGEGIDPDRRRRLARERFRMVWFRHHLRAHIANRRMERRRMYEAEAREEGSEREDDQNSDAEINNWNGNSESSGSASLSVTNNDVADTSIDVTEPNSDGGSSTGRSKKRSLVEHEGENSSSAKRRNDDDNGQKEIMETDPVDDYNYRENKNQPGDESGATNIDKEPLITEPGKTSSHECENNQTKCPEETRSLDGSIPSTENEAESVNCWPEEVVQQSQDLHRKTENNEDGMENTAIGRKKSIPGNNQRMNHQDLVSVPNNLALENSTLDQGKNEENDLELSNPINQTIQNKNSEVPNETSGKKLVNNLTNNEVLCRKSDKIEESFQTELRNDKMIWQNNELYKNIAETCSTSLHNANNQTNEELIDTSSYFVETNENSVIKPEQNNIRFSSAKKEEKSDDIVEDVDSDNGNDSDDDDDSNDGDDDDNDSDNDNDDDSEVDGHSNDNSSSSGAEEQENAAEGDSDNSFNVNREENELYLAIRQTTQSMADAVGHQANRNPENNDESDSSANEYHDAMDGESTSPHRSDAGDELQTEEEKQRERGRLEERGQQMNDIRTFASIFESRIMELPLNRALKEYIKYLC
uniref:Uncharacterized protein n=1 Tax=Setaria digitata TaxID=48799 RepID=A0A915PF83_9BILA